MTYHYSLVAVNNGVAGSSGDKTFIQGEIGVPIINNVEAASITHVSATLRGCINPNGFLATAAYVEWGLDTNYGNVTATTIFPGGGIDSNNTCAYSIVQLLENLGPATRYHYRVVASNQLGIARSGDMAFTTHEALGFYASVASNITQFSATIYGNAYAPRPNYPFATAVWLEWGQSPDYGYIATARPATLTDLLPDTTYYFRVTASNEVAVFHGAETSFRTLPLTVPSVTNVYVQRQRVPTAILHGSVNPNGTADSIAFFEWGIDASYGNRSEALSIPFGTSPIPIESQITGLTTGMVYHFRLVTSNSLGITASVDQTFANFEPLQLFEGESWTYRFQNLPFVSRIWGNAMVLGYTSFAMPPGSFSSNALLTVELFESDTNVTTKIAQWSPTNSVPPHVWIDALRLWDDRAGAVRLNMTRGTVTIHSLGVGALLQGENRFQDTYQTNVTRLDSGELTTSTNTPAVAQ